MRSKAYLGSSFDHLVCDFGFAANTNGVVGANFLDELLLRQRLGVMVDMESLRLECPHGFLADVFEDQELQVFILDWVQNLGESNCSTCDCDCRVGSETIVQGSRRAGRDRS